MIDDPNKMACSSGNILTSSSSSIEDLGALIASGITRAISKGFQKELYGLDHDAKKARLALIEPIYQGVNFCVGVSHGVSVDIMKKQ